MYNILPSKLINILTEKNILNEFINGKQESEYKYYINIVHNIYF